MVTTVKNTATKNNVTNLADVRAAKNQAMAESPDIANEPEAAESEHGNRKFDAAKVARIKAAIASGEYQVDPSRIADRFIEHDRNQ